MQILLYDAAGVYIDTVTAEGFVERADFAGAYASGGKYDYIIRHNYFGIQRAVCNLLAVKSPVGRITLRGAGPSIKGALERAIFNSYAIQIIGFYTSPQLILPSTYTATQTRNNLYDITFELAGRN